MIRGRDKHVSGEGCELWGLIVKSASLLFHRVDFLLDTLFEVTLRAV